jgi:hypothetical protein
MELEQEKTEITETKPLFPLLPPVICHPCRGMALARVSPVGCSGNSGGQARNQPVSASFRLLNPQIRESPSKLPTGSHNKLPSLKTSLSGGSIGIGRYQGGTRVVPDHPEGVGGEELYSGCLWNIQLPTSNGQAKPPKATSMRYQSHPKAC